ncbi:hypothetical protein [Turicimonas muris]|uniref:hypothetical protein n=1 Tax=Turicimonas muris TaxID=1796652 RepID=UPI00248D386E|nr:hypothetical protein [Turicimonas muris]
MYIARLKDENGNRIEIEEEVIMELWSRLAERGFWRQPEDPIHDMQTEKEWLQAILDGMDPERVESIIIFGQEPGEVKRKLAELSDVEMAYRYDEMMEKRKEETEKN